MSYKIFKNNRKICVFFISFFAFLVLMVVFVGANFVFKTEPIIEESNNDGSKFSSNFIRAVHKYNKNDSNYLISPYSAEFTLDMLRVGADGESKEELDKVINREVPVLSNNYVKKANGLFIKEKYKEYVDTRFVSSLSAKYKSEVMYDEFKTPELINAWANKNTDGMIPSVMNDIDEKFVLAIGNAIAIDAHWKNEFDAGDTRKSEFKLNNGSSMDVSMMHNEFRSDVKYLDGIDKGIKLSYDENLDFIAIKPGDGVDNFVSNFTASALDDILGDFKSASEKDRVNLALPKFSYDYDVSSFVEILEDMGLKSIFSEEKADLSGIISKEKLKFLDVNNIYVGGAVHKTKIDLNEKGTKAAAVTVLAVMETSSMEDMSGINIHNIIFDEPFVYLIRDSLTHEVLFFGVVYKPNEWTGEGYTQYN